MAWLYQMHLAKPCCSRGLVEYFCIIDSWFALFVKCWNGYRCPFVPESPTKSLWLLRISILNRATVVFSHILPPLMVAAWPFSTFPLLFIAESHQLRDMCTLVLFPSFCASHIYCCQSKLGGVPWSRYEPWEVWLGTVSRSWRERGGLWGGGVCGIAVVVGHTSWVCFWPLWHMSYSP